MTHKPVAAAPSAAPKTAGIVVLPTRASFFSSPAEEAALERDNSVFWDALLAHIEADSHDLKVETLLDVGCHQGGLLLRLASSLKAKKLVGIEPVFSVREIATRRLQSAGFAPVILDTADWNAIEDGVIDLAVCHEVLYLLPSLGEIMSCFRRVLRPGATAYVVLGCHEENPVWRQRKPLMEAEGHAVYSHRPMDIMSAAAKAGLTPFVRPLRRDGWVGYDPTRARFKFPDVSTMFDHHFRQKLLFRFVLRP